MKVNEISLYFPLEYRQTLAKKATVLMERAEEWDLYYDSMKQMMKTTMSLLLLMMIQMIPSYAPLTLVHHCLRQNWWHSLPVEVEGEELVSATGSEAFSTQIHLLGQVWKPGNSLSDPSIALPPLLAKPKLML